MTLNFGKLFPSQLLAGSAALIQAMPTASSSYLLRNGRVRLTNTSASPVAVTLYAVPAGGAVALTNEFFPGIAVPAHDYMDVDLPQLAAGDALWGFCTAYGTVTIFAIDGVLLS